MVSINNLTKINISGIFLRRVAKIVLKGENDITKEISVVLVDKKEIQKINKKYRGKDAPTDVLSFEELDEIFICPEVIKKEDLAFVLIHGILHLLGYNHEGAKKEAEKMKEKEKYYFNEILSTKS